jgi:hypothetical protein
LDVDVSGFNHPSKEKVCSKHSKRIIRLCWPGQIEKRLWYARNILANTHYKSEKEDSCKSYVTKLLEAFEIFKKEMTVLKRQKLEKCWIACLTAA